MICHVYIGDKPEKDAIPEIIAAVEMDFGKPVQPATTGIYVVSNCLGTNSALLFWAEVIKSGPAFANPELFPWTLANSVGGYIARYYGITGPNYTFTGPPENPDIMNEVLQKAREDQQSSRLSAVWIIAIH